MKLAPSYVSKERLIKKIAKRSQERIAEHTIVSSAFQPKEAELVKENLDSAARYANRHHCNLEFMPNFDNLTSKNGTKVNVYRREIDIVSSYDGSNDLYIPTHKFKGTAIIGSDINNKKDFMKSLRTQVKEILSK